MRNQLARDSHRRRPSNRNQALVNVQPWRDKSDLEWETANCGVWSTPEKIWKRLPTRIFSYLNQFDLIGDEPEVEGMKPRLTMTPSRNFLQWGICLASSRFALFQSWIWIASRWVRVQLRLKKWQWKPSKEKGLFDMKILSIDADAKTVKGLKKGYRTAISYLGPVTPAV